MPIDTTNGATPETARRFELAGAVRTLAHRLAGDRSVLPDEGRLGSFDSATGWLNSDPLTPESLRGRVVLVDFWTYTCVNWLRTLPYRRAWHAKYREHGLTIVGVHTPEFGFERNVDNVIRQSRDFRVEYPIAIDSDYGVWRAFANHFWPALYLADADGRIRYHHFGEGEYAAAEMAIQQLLLDAGAEGLDRDLVMVEPDGLEVAADWRTLQSPETYLGYRQASGFAQEDVARLDAPSAYEAPGRLALNQWALSGAWTVAGHAAVLNEPGRVAFQFHARDVNLVMGPSVPGTSARFRVFLDGEPAGDEHGADVDSTGAGTVDGQRTFQLVRQAGPIDDRRFEIEFLDPGVEAYCFTFG
ncbi:MAG: thioredoxin [Chloroflexota bacterium]